MTVEKAGWFASDGMALVSEIQEDSIRGREAGDFPLLDDFLSYFFVPGHEGDEHPAADGRVSPVDEMKLPLQIPGMLAMGLPASAAVPGTTTCAGTDESARALSRTDGVAEFTGFLSATAWVVVLGAGLTMCWRDC